MLCARECPDWCIYIEGHKYKAPPRRPGGKPRQKNALDRFDIDFALCMYCGICVEVCPFEALFWSPEFEFSEPKLADLLHDKGQLSKWMETVPDSEQKQNDYGTYINEDLSNCYEFCSEENKNSCRAR